MTVIALFLVTRLGSIGAVRVVRQPPTYPNLLKTGYAF